MVTVVLGIVGLEELIQTGKFSVLSVTFTKIVLEDRTGGNYSCCSHLQYTLFTDISRFLSQFEA